MIIIRKDLIVSDDMISGTGFQNDPFRPNGVIRTVFPAVFFPAVGIGSGMVYSVSLNYDSLDLFGIGEYARVFIDTESMDRTIPYS